MGDGIQITWGRLVLISMSADIDGFVNLVAKMVVKRCSDKGSGNTE